MVKINKNAIIVFFLLAAVAVSIHPLLALTYLPYKLFLVYAVLFTAAFFMAKDMKVDRKEFTHAMLFTVGAAMLGAGQYVFSFFNHHILIYGVFLMLAGIAVITAAFVKYGRKEEKQAETVNIRAEAVAVAVLIAAAFIMRFWDLSGFLPGVWFDEAQNGNEALRIMKENKLEIFISRYTHMPAMYFYFAAAAIKIFGFNIFPLRLVSCVLGTLSVLAFYFLAKQVFKDWKYALLAAFLLAFSRWHITFSRVAFLGMQTVLFEILFLYFYLKFFESKSAVHAAIAGALLGLSQYTFSAANFLAVFAVLHIAVRGLKDLKAFVPVYASGIFIMAAAAFITAGPLIGYAVSNKDAFFQRAADISIMKDIKDNKNLNPVLKNLKTYSLAFNFEGDYNGRHDLYKKAMLDDIGGVFFIIGLIAAFGAAGKSFIPGLMLVMLLPGLLTITIEAPQTYRIIGVIPAVYLLIALGVKSAAGSLGAVSGDKRGGIVFTIVAAISMAAINFHRYFILYPKHEATYMSFSPESNGVANFINKNIDDYEIIVSNAEKLYGFYMWEQNVICDFINYGKGKFRYLAETNALTPALLEGKRGAIVITRPSDKQAIQKLEKEYAGKIADKEVYTNPFSGAEIYTCWFINKADVLTSPGKILYLK